ncbi:hypothetical protein [Aureimonas glaciei]|uniref:Uncharacterized protein n=1 Tax=Aureimonas glaciei TaxID=1776957 RepID=A0A916YHC5_9HYPH|nr:hypothetical protein [Aureimonas glaciei]GGD43436.1 hypothetical protein GCM10011335_52570 [Aureimonas glaciei]
MAAQANVSRRGWVLITGAIPAGCARAWQAIVDGNSVAGIFKIVAGGTFMLSYQAAGDGKPTVEGFATFDKAQERANLVLSTRMVVGKPIGLAA